MFVQVSADQFRFTYRRWAEYKNMMAALGQQLVQLIEFRLSPNESLVAPPPGGFRMVAMNYSSASVQYSPEQGVQACL